MEGENICRTGEAVTDETLLGELIDFKEKYETNENDSMSRMRRCSSIDLIVVL